MFCLQCGAEAPARAVTCSVCGHDLGRTAAELRASAAALPPPPVLSSLPAAMAGIHAGDLDQPGFPRDAMGRALLIVAVALMADVFLPWRYVYGQHEALPGPGALLVALLAVLAALPLFHPRLRKQPLAAMLPLLIGGISLGLGVAFFIYLAHSNDVANLSLQVSNDPNSSPLLVSSSQQILVSPDLGLFLFILGAAVLVVIGYYFFLAAARVPQVSMSVGAAILPPATYSAAIATVGIADDARLALQTSSTSVRYADDSLPGSPAPALAPEAVTVAAAQPANPPNKPTTPQIVLPGSDAWNRTPEPPTIVRPKAGSIRRSVR